MHRILRESNVQYTVYIYGSRVSNFLFYSSLIAHFFIISMEHFAQDNSPLVHYSEIHPLCAVIIIQIQQCGYIWRSISSHYSYLLWTDYIGMELNITVHVGLLQPECLHEPTKHFTTYDTCSFRVISKYLNEALHFPITTMSMAWEIGLKRET